MNAILIFTIATIVNVTLSTVRSLCTIKGGKMLSAITNAICYGFYPLVIVLTAQGTVGILLNMAITASANFVCVYLIKLLEEKGRKDKLWKVEATVTPCHSGYVQEDLDALGIPHNSFYTSGEHRVFNIFCSTQSDSIKVKEVLNKYHAKYFVSESKTL